MEVMSLIVSALRFFQYKKAAAYVKLIISSVERMRNRSEQIDK